MSHALFNILVLVWMAVALLTMVVLFRVVAPFGRHTSDTFGPTMPNHWGWCVMEVPSLLSLSYFFFTGSLSPTPLTWFMYGLWALHYLNRSFVYPFRQRDKSKRMPVAIVGSAIFFNLINGFFNGYYLGNFADFSADWWWSLPFMFGTILFFAGMLINMHSDHVLLNLRKPGEKTYRIPKGGLFRWVSCPNLFGEMVEWAGYALLTWNLASLSFAVWTVANLLPRAMAHHRWYQRRFPDYPSGRKAVIPGVL
ncbi:MAG: DUF1295 domain-containing protein [Cryomorphaceae bacterium]|nr:MAG: DUF1295 domain-containing protein [Cryomorphaceae bacterium]